MSIVAGTSLDRGALRGPALDLLRSEWIKITSLRIAKVLVGLAAAVALANTWAVAMFVTDRRLVAAEVFAYPTVVTALLASVAGILVFTSEVRHGTLAVVLVAHPRRGVVAAAKAASAMASGMVLGLVGMAAGFAGAVMGGLEVGDVESMAATFAWALAFNALAALLGLGVGMVVRGTAGALTGLLAWWFVVETILVELMPDSASRFLPYVAGFRMLGVATEFEQAAAVEWALTQVQATLVFGAYAAVALGVGTALLRYRDAP